MNRLALVMSAMSLVSCGAATTPEQEAEDFLEFLEENPLASDQYWSGARLWICTPETLAVCSKGNCESADPNIELRWYPETDRLQRCNNGSCDDYDVATTHSGSFTNLTLLGSGGGFVKIATGGDYIETQSSMLQTFNYSGTCVALGPKGDG